MDEDAELRNPFPSPPGHYTNYTTHNLDLLLLLRERSADSLSPNQHEILVDQRDVPDWPLIQLEKPRVDWILEDSEGHYDVFGDRWFIKEPIPSLAELGGHQLYPADPSVDRRPALLSILRSLLATYSALMTSLLAPPPTASSSVSPNWQRHVEWITVMGQNIMAAANDLRPVQARGNLELMMRRQLDLRKEETMALHGKCNALEAKLSELRGLGQRMAQKVTREDPVGEGPSTMQDAFAHLSMDGSKKYLDITVEREDVLCWAEEIR